MSKQIGQISNFVGGIADSLKFGVPYSFAWGRSLEFRADPSQLTVTPRSERQAAGIITDLPMWGDLAISQTYFYGNTGNVYLKDANDTWTVDHLVPNSQGNGLAYFPEDNYLYAAANTTLSRRFNATGVGTWYDAFLETEGGAPTNTNSVTLVAASTQYASIASQASLQITLDIAMEAYVKLTTLPASSAVQTIMSKWNQNGNQRSYKFDITTSSNFFGNGQDGALTISSNTTEAPIDSACTGTIATNQLTATNVSFAVGQKILIHQSQGTGAGTIQYTTIDAYTAGTITTHDLLTATFGTGAQVRVMPQYSSVTINTGITYTAKAWNGTVGGILAFYCSGTLTVTGSIVGTGCGFRGGTGDPGGGNSGIQGEGYLGTGITSVSANGNGGGGGGGSASGGAGGGGGSETLTGGMGSQNIPGAPGPITYGSVGGSPLFAADATSFVFGGGGGQGGEGNDAQPGQPQTSASWWIGGDGGNGGGAILGFASTISITGSIISNGNNGSSGQNSSGGGAGGAPGVILLKYQTATFGTGLIQANVGGSGGAGSRGAVDGGGAGGTGDSQGLVVGYYATSTTGTTLPTINLILNTTLSNVSGYVIRFLVSSNGTNSEIYTQDITNVLQVSQWARYSVSWQASTSTASFYRNGVLLGTQTGTFTGIYSSTASFALGTSYDGSGNPQDLLNGELDDARLWNAVRNQSQIQLYNDRVLTGVETNLSGYWKLDNNFNDSQTYTTTANLTGTNTPVFTTDVGFAGLTVRNDQDVSITTSGGQTYTLLTSLSEAANDRRSFLPTKEPLKSLSVNISAVGTGNWTVVVHDGLNRVLTSMTVLNAQLHTGIYEFVFPTVSRPILTAVYHVHIYSTVGDGALVTSTASKMEGDTATPQTSLTTGSTLYTYFQILVSDTYHPIMQFLNFLVVGNERYVAQLQAGDVYSPHQLTLPAGYHVRCFALFNEYVAIGCTRFNGVTQTDQGKIFLWDGTSDVTGNSSPNYIIDVLHGGVNAMTGAGGILNIIAGYKGKLLQYGGGSYSYAGPQASKVKQFPFLASTEYCEVAPGAMCMWQSILQTGGFINTNSSTLHEGVYGYGSLNVNYPDGLGFDYPLSIGDQQNSMVKVGCLFPQGQDLYIGWQNGNAYGIDRIVTSNQPYATATLELLINSMQDMSKLKMPVRMRIDFESLTSGQVITAKYKPNRQATWNTIGTMSTVGARELSVPINQLNREIQLAVDITSTDTSPIIYQITLESENIPSPV